MNIGTVHVCVHVCVSVFRRVSHQWLWGPAWLSTWQCWTETAANQGYYVSNQIQQRGSSLQTSVQWADGKWPVVEVYKPPCSELMENDLILATQTSWYQATGVVPGNSLTFVYTESRQSQCTKQLLFTTTAVSCQRRSVSTIKGAKVSQLHLRST